MRNIDRIRAMDAEQLAGFLVENGAPVPTEFCDILCAEDCMICPFVGPNGDKKAWQTYLESEYGGEEKEDDQEPEELQTDEQGDSEQGGNEKETDKQGSERSDGSGPAGGRNQ